MGHKFRVNHERRKKQEAHSKAELIWDRLGLEDFDLADTEIVEQYIEELQEDIEQFKEYRKENLKG